MKSADELEKIIYSYLPQEETLAEAMRQAMNYSVTAGGKRIRPRMMLETCRMFGGSERAAEPFMAAIEMIHSYSLVHDDLPAMDNDTLRRGKPTTWKAYGEAAGILAGDGLLTFAFETAMKAVQTGADPAAVVKAMAILSRKAGLYGMVGGQAVDVALAGKPMDEKTMLYIYENKTGALIEASMMIGAVLAGATDEQILICEKIASDIGMAFQIRDDILDVTSSEAELGKPIGSDERNEKTTYVTVYGLEKAQAEVERLTAHAISLLDTLPGDKEYFADFIKKLGTRKN